MDLFLQLNFHLNQSRVYILFYIVFVRESHELFIVGALTSQKIIVEVTDSNMSYEVPSNNTLRRLISVMQDPPDLRAPYLLIFGHPGCGKTRFIHELLEASRTSLVSSVAEEVKILPGVDLTFWAVVPVSFNSQTEISMAESSINFTLRFGNFSF